MYVINQIALHYILRTKPVQLTVFRKINNVYCHNHVKHINALCGLNSGFIIFKQQVHTVTTNSTLKLL